MGRQELKVQQEDRIPPLDQKESKGECCWKVSEEMIRLEHSTTWVFKKEDNNNVWCTKIFNKIMKMKM